MLILIKTTTEFRGSAYNENFEFHRRILRAWTQEWDYKISRKYKTDIFHNREQ